MWLAPQILRRDKHCHRSRSPPRCPELICPGVDWSWLLTITKRIAAAAPRRHLKYHLVTSDRLYALGLELMDGAITNANAAKHISKAHAFQYRDGLIIAFLAIIPLRSRTFVAMRIGIHLVKTGELWGLDLLPRTPKIHARSTIRSRESCPPHRFVSGAVPRPHSWGRKTHRSMGIQLRPPDVRHGHL